MGLSKLSLAPDQVSPRFGANLVGSLFVHGRYDKKEGGAPVLFMVVKIFKSLPALEQDQ